MPSATDGASFKKNILATSTNSPTFNFLIGCLRELFVNSLEMAKMSKCQQLLRGFEPMTSPLKHFVESASDMFQDISD